MTKRIGVALEAVEVSMRYVRFGSKAVTRRLPCDRLLSGVKRTVRMSLDQIEVLSVRFH